MRLIRSSEGESNIYVSQDSVDFGKSKFLDKSKMIIQRYYKPAIYIYWKNI